MAALASSDLDYSLELESVSLAAGTVDETAACNWFFLFDGLHLRKPFNSRISTKPFCNQRRRLVVTYSLDLHDEHLPGSIYPQGPKFKIGKTGQSRMSTAWVLTPLKVT